MNPYSNCSGAVAGASLPYAGFSRLSLYLLGISFLVACGGGGGGSSGDPISAPDCNTWPAFLELNNNDGNSEVLTAINIGNCTVAIAGYFDSTATGYPEGNSRGFIRALTLSSYGEVTTQWTETIESANTDAINVLKVFDNNLYFTGTTEGQLPGQTAYGETDLILGAISKAGDPLKLSQLGNQKPNQPVELIKLANGDFFLVGYDEAYIPTNFVDTWEDPWLAGITQQDDHFTLDWLQNADSADIDFYTAGALADFIIATALHAGNGPNRGISLETRNEASQLLWNLPLSPSPYDIISNLYYLGNDELLVFGTTYVALGSTVPGGGDYFVLKLNLQNREIIWVTQFGDSDINWARALTVVDNQIFIAGESSPDTANWTIDVYRLNMNGEVLGNMSDSFGINAGVRQILPLADGLLLVGSYQPDNISRKGYLAFYPRSSI